MYEVAAAGPRGGRAGREPVEGFPGVPTARRPGRRGMPYLPGCLRLRPAVLLLVLPRELQLRRDARRPDAVSRFLPVPRRAGPPQPRRAVRPGGGPRRAGPPDRGDPVPPCGGPAAPGGQGTPPGAGRPLPCVPEPGGGRRTECVVPGRGFPGLLRDRSVRASRPALLPSSPSGRPILPWPARPSAGPSRPRRFRCAEVSRLSRHPRFRRAGSSFIGSSRPSGDRDLAWGGRAGFSPGLRPAPSATGSRRQGTGFSRYSSPFSRPRIIGPRSSADTDSVSATSPAP